MRPTKERSKLFLIGTVLMLVIGACNGNGDGAEGNGDTDGTSDGNGEQEVEQISFVQPVPPSLLYYPGIVAEELGFFDDANLEVELLTAGDITEAALIDQGDAEVAFAGFPEVAAGIVQNVDYEVVYDGYHLAVEGIVVPADSDIQGMEDLEGLTVGLASDSDLALLNVALNFVGLPPDSVDTVVTGDVGPTVVNSMETGEIAAFAGAASDFAAMGGAGLELRFITPEEMIANPGGSAIVMREQIEARGDALERFFRAWAQGQHVGVASPDVLEAIVRDLIPEEWENEDVASASLEGAIERWTPAAGTYGEIRPDVWDTALEQLVDAGELDEMIPSDDYLNDQFIAGANDFDQAAVEEAAQAWMNENG